MTRDTTIGFIGVGYMGHGKEPVRSGVSDVDKGQPKSHPRRQPDQQRGIGGG